MRVQVEPKDPRHQKLIELMNSCFKLSGKYMRQRYPAWQKSDKMDRSFIDVSETDRKGKKKNPFERQIYIPMSRACKDTMLSYWMQVFCGKRPTFPIQGRTPEDVRAAKLNEVLLDYQCERQRIALLVYAFLNDVAKYSCGSIKNLFIRHYRPGFEIEKELKLFPAPHYETRRHQVKKLAYEGPEFTNNDPYKFYPDPRVSLGKAQSGQFQGFEYGRSLYYLKKRQEDGVYYNINHLTRDDSGGFEPEDGSGDERNRIMGISTPATIEDLRLDNKNPHFRIRELFVELIPRDYGLSKSNYPEIWVLAMAGTNIVIRSEKSIYAHEQFPTVLGEYDYDGYSLFTQSFYEGQEGLQDLLNWLYNCYDNKTEVLTSNGWVPLPELTADHKVATVSSESKELWFEKPKQIFKYDYTGELICLESKQMDVRVTPNHKLWVKNRKGKEWGFLEANQVSNDSRGEYITQSTIRWHNNLAPQTYTIPALQGPGQGKYARGYDAVEIDIDIWLAWLAWWLSDGSISHGRQSGSYCTTIRQKDIRHIDEIDELFKKMPFHTTRSADACGAVTWVITHKGLYAHLLDIAGSGAYNKRIPAFIQTLGTDKLKGFFKISMKGDAHWSRSNLVRFSSRSKNLVDGYQVIALKLGYNAHAIETKAGEKPFYYVNINTNGIDHYCCPRNRSKQQYAGKVYCFENSTHLTVIRRNGKVAVHGQSHMDNVRRFLNDMLVVDPSAVEIRDIIKPSPAKIIRLKKQLWGKGVNIDSVLKQLRVSDVTASHIKDGILISNMMQRRAHTPDAMQGIQTEIKRTATEIAKMTSSGSNILGTGAILLYAQALIPLAEMSVMNNQQFLSEERFYRVVGDYAKEFLTTPDPRLPGMSGANIGPADIQGYFDFPVDDGRLPVRATDNAKVWAQIFKIIAQAPPIQAQVDIFAVFNELARSLGVKNIEQFKLGTQILPDGQIEKHKQAGDIISLGDYLGYTPQVSPQLSERMAA